MISSCSGTLATFQDNTIHFDSLLPGCRSYQPPLHVCLLQNQITTSAPISAANNLMTLVILSIATQPLIQRQTGIIPTPSHSCFSIDPVLNFLRIVIWQKRWAASFCLNGHFLWDEPPPLPFTFVISSRENLHFF